MTVDESSGQGVDRVATILRALGQGERSGMRLIEIVAATGLSKTTVHRTLASLQKVGFVEQDEANGHFHLGFELFALGMSAVNRHGLVDLAHEAMVRLATRTADTAFLSIRSGADSICLSRREGDFPIKTLTLSVGDRRPLGVGAGSLALLAFLPEGEVERVIEQVTPRLASYPNYTAATLFHLVEETRQQGYASNEGLIIPEMWAVAVPVLEPGGRPVAALSVATIRSRMDDQRRANIVAWLSGEAETLARKVAVLSSRINPARQAEGQSALLQRALGID